MVEGEQNRRGFGVRIGSQWRIPRRRHRWTDQTGVMTTDGSAGLSRLVTRPTASIKPPCLSDI